MTKGTYAKFNIWREEIDALIFEEWTLDEGGRDDVFLAI